MGTPFAPARPRLVVSLGDNALGRGADHDSALRVDDAARHLAPLAEQWDLILTHGTGRRLGDSGDKGARAGRPVASLDVLEADSDSLFGYQLETALSRAVPQSDVATLLTRVVVDVHDPAFAHPDRPVGPLMLEDEASRLALERGWFVRANGDGWRRVVASPEPVRILEQRALEVLVAAGVTVVCAGGGGIPVVVDATGVHGVSAVIDKDLAAAMVAIAVQADALLLLTDVEAVFESFGLSPTRAIATMGSDTARAGVWPTRTIGPKIEACCRFVQHSSRWAAIGALEDALDIVEARAGTRITDGSAPTAYRDQGAT